MRRIVFSTSYGVFEHTITNRLSPLWEILSTRGWGCFVVTACFEAEIKEINSCTIISVLCDSRKPSNFFLRAVYEFKIARRVQLLRNIIRTDAELISIPSMFDLLIYRRARLNRSATVFLDIRDLTWEYLNQKKILRLVRFLIRFLVKKKVRHFDFFSCTNEAEYLYIVNQLGLPLSRVHLMRNGISKAIFEQFERLPMLRPNVKPRLLYLGNIGKAQGISELVMFGRSRPDIDIIIAGAGVESEVIQCLISREKLKNVFYVGSVGLSAKLDLYSKSDILFAQLLSGYDSAVPSKVYEYLAVGKPIIYVGSGAAAKFLNGFTGVLVLNEFHQQAVSEAVDEAFNWVRATNVFNKNREKLWDSAIREHEAEKFINMYFD